MNLEPIPEYTLDRNTNTTGHQYYLLHHYTNHLFVHICYTLCDNCYNNFCGICSNHSPILSSISHKNHMLLVRDLHTSQSGGIHDSVDGDELTFDDDVFGNWPLFFSVI